VQAKQFEAELPEESDPLEQLDITKYLVIKKPDEEGPDIRGGHPDALIIHATKANKNGELQFVNGCSIVEALCSIPKTEIFVSVFHACGTEEENETGKTSVWLMFWGSRVLLLCVDIFLSRCGPLHFLSSSSPSEIFALCWLFSKSRLHLFVFPDHQNLLHIRFPFCSFFPDPVFPILCSLMLQVLTSELYLF
jgi:hypothetical protein